MNKKLIAEAKGHMAHKIAPTLLPNIRGLFRVRLLGLYRHHAKLSISLVNDRREVLKHFGTTVVPAGGAGIVDQFSSLMTIAENAPPVKAYFQAWVIGINTDNTEAEISLRLVDENRKELMNFGSVTRKQGGTITLEGLEIVANIIPKELVA